MTYMNYLIIIIVAIVSFIIGRMSAKNDDHVLGKEEMNEMREDAKEALARRTEAENKIKQIGTTGKDVYYTLFHQN